jgi:hypothetical protein
MLTSEEEVELGVDWWMIVGSFLTFCLKTIPPQASST